MMSIRLANVMAVKIHLHIAVQHEEEMFNTIKDKSMSTLRSLYTRKY